MTRTVDVAILGSGFGGSLLSMILHRLGLRVALIERHSHPRFAIGESSTPTADMILTDLCERFDLPQILPLARYGSWRRTYPQIDCGLKRGFSYFGHQPGQHFTADEEHSTELIVSASDSDELGDTHWLRADVDQFLVQEATQLGIEYHDQTIAKPRPTGDSWAMLCRNPQQQFQLHAGFVVDASGVGRALADALQLSDQTNRLHTNSRAIFGHFAGLPLWEKILDDRHIPVGDYPFPCDVSAQHHLLSEGWMWQLRFDSGVTSAGIMIDGQEAEPSSWESILNRYPSLDQQFGRHDVSAVEPIQETGRVQRMLNAAADDSWVLLPHSFAFIDPLHSTGIAHTIYCIEQLSDVFARGVPADALASYSRDLQRDFLVIDQLVHGCYVARHDFSLFADYSMLYFAAATMFERQRLAGEQPSFLCAGDKHFTAFVAEAHQRLCQSVQLGQRDDFSSWLKEAIEPFNFVGLMDPSLRNMYERTSAK